MDAAVIHHDDVIASEHWNQAVFDIGKEHLCGHGTLDHHRGDHFIVTQSGHEGDRLPSSKRNSANHPDATRGSPSQSHHVRADGGLVDKTPAGQDQAYLALVSTGGAPAPHLLAAVRLLAGLFLRVMLCRSRKRQSELRLVLIRRLRSSATVSTKLRSGCRAIRSKISPENSSSGEMLPPRGFGAALLC